METVSSREGDRRSDGRTEHNGTPRLAARVDVVLMAAVAAPTAMALALTPWRGRLDTADNALFLVVVIVGVASAGRRIVALVAALTAALSFDFFLTRPYYSFRITRHQDLITELLLLVLGIAVGELAARGRGHLREATQSKETVALLHSVTELVAAGREPREVINAALANLQQLLGLEDCYFTRRDPGNLSARINPHGELTVAGQTWATEDLGLPTSRVDLPVRAQGWLLGHFVLTPTRGRTVEAQRLLTAVAVADLVGAVLLADDPGLDPSGGRAPDHWSSPDGRAAGDRSD